LSAGQWAFFRTHFLDYDGTGVRKKFVYRNVAMPELVLLKVRHVT